LVFTANAGLNTAGLGPNGKGSSIRIVTQSDLELQGNITAGATVRQTFGTNNQLLSESYEWSGRDSRIEIEATGRVLVGANVLDKFGVPVQKGVFLRASDGISIRGGGNASGFGVVMYPTSGLSVNKSTGSITIDSKTDADIQGMVVAGGEILLVQDQAGATVGYDIQKFQGDSTLRIASDQQVRLGRDVYAAKSINVFAGGKPPQSTTGPQA
jgi:hypothetical protein